MMMGEGSMMFAMVLVWLLMVIVLVLVGAAAFKYLFYHPTERRPAPTRSSVDPSGNPPLR
jgi:hypothetical protein